MKRYENIILFEKSMINPRLRDNFTKLLKSNLYVQLMSFASIPIISRLFEPEDFGLLAIYSAVVALLASVSTLRFDWLIPSIKSTRIAIILFCFGSIFALIFIFLVSFSLYYNVLTLGPSSLKSLQPIWFLIPIGLLFLSFLNLLKGWAIRTGELRVIAKINWQQTLVKISCNLFMGFSGIFGFGLVLSLIISRAIGFLRFLSLFKEHLPLLLSTQFHWINKILSLFFKKALLSSFISFVNSLSTNIMIITLAVHYSSSELGLLAFANRIVAAPVGVASRALSQAFWSRAAELTRTSNYKLLRQEYFYITVRLVYFAIPVIISIVIVSQLTEFIFGANWKNAGIVLLAMIPLFLGTIIVAPTNHLIALQKPHLQLIADLSRVLLMVASIFLSIYLDLFFTTAVFLCCCASLVGYIILGGLQLYAHASLSKMYRSLDAV
jgi:O-antigen/teichoic acid export membrane protein